jgi:glycosyltransferase involved in cell wall biosynthesis
VNKRKIAMFHNVPYGGALRGVLEIGRRLKEDFEVDLVEFDMNRQMPDLWNFRPIEAAFNEADGDYFSRVVRFDDPRHDFAPLAQRFGQEGLGRFLPFCLLWDLYSIKRAYGNVQRYLNREGYDLVLVSPSRLTQAPYFIEGARAKVVYFCHEPWTKRFSGPAKRTENSIKRFAYRALEAKMAREDSVNTRAADLVLANSEFSKSRIEKVYGKSCMVFYFGVDADRFKPSTAETGRPNRVVAVSALFPYKGQDFILSSIAGLEPELRPEIVFCFSRYDPKFRLELEEKARMQGIEVKMVEGASDEEIVRLYNTCRAAVFAPFAEPFGMVALEAMSCGLPVVGVADGGLRETVIEGVTGFLTQRDENAFADALTTVLSDDLLRRNMGLAARKVIEEKWTWDASASRLRTIINSILAD